MGKDDFDTNVINVFDNKPQSAAKYHQVKNDSFLSMAPKYQNVQHFHSVRRGMSKIALFSDNFCNWLQIINKTSTIKKVFLFQKISKNIYKYIYIYMSLRRFGRNRNITRIK